MKVAGSAVLHVPVEQAWDALLDPAVLVRTIPGCERLETTGDNTYAMTVTAGVASIKGTYAGKCALSDLHPHESLLLHAEGAGGPGTVTADVTVRFADLGDGTTGIDYAADAVVGGMVGGVGQRMLTSVSRRMAGEFFGAVDATLAGGGADERGGAVGGGADQGEQAPARTAGAGQVFSAPGRPASRGVGGEDFVKGAVVGGALVLAGVLVGALAGRRR